MFIDTDDIPPALKQTDAFLASPSGMRGADGEVDKQGVRYKAWASAPQSLFVAECSWPGFLPGEGRTELSVAVALLAQIRASRRFICLLTGASPGSAVRMSQASLETTFFELEIFQSIVLEKPTYLLVHHSFDPTGIAKYLDLLDFALPDWRSRAGSRLSDKQAIDAIQAIRTGRGGEPWRVRRRPDEAARFHMSLLRSRDRFLRGEQRPTVQFLDLPSQMPSKKEPNLDNVHALLDARSQMLSTSQQTNDRRLALSWLLLRELVAAPLLDAHGELIQRDPFVLSAWNLALGDWHSTASWGGLHANIHLGTLPALGTLESVRKGLRGPLDLNGESTKFPGGGYATSYYSLSKLVPSADRAIVLDVARKTLLMDIEAQGERTPGHLAMLGSIALQDGHVQEAIDMYEAALAIHTGGGNYRSMGELLCELSLARMQVGESRRAADEAARGIALMRQPQSGEDVPVDGFLVRAMFKSAFVQARGGRVVDGLQLYAEALKQAKVQGYADQTRQWGPAGVARRVAKAARRRMGF